MKGKVSVTVTAGSHRADGRVMLTQCAFVLALATVVARCAVLETLRDPFAVSPGVSLAARGAGPGTSLALDLLCCVPAILVLLRRVVDPAYILRWSLAEALMLPLAAWMALSLRWADDRFATLIGVANFAAALALLWAVSQLVRSWARLRIVAAVVFGLLLVFLVQGFYYKFLDLPDTAAFFLQNKTQFLKERGLEPGSFAAKQLENKILSGEVIGFAASTNSFAATMILLMTIGAGAAIGRWANRQNVWAIATALPMGLAAWLLIYTNSKAALGAPILATLLFLLVWRYRQSMAIRSKRWFWAGVVCVALTIAAVAGHGIFHHGLPTASLNFRWRYWVASAHMFLRHPIRGIGWDNFGQRYLRDRLPVASEEIRDPHDFIIRFFVELGCVGGALMIAWMLRLWWEMTRPNTPLLPPKPRGATKAHPAWVLAPLVGIALLSIFLNTFISIDFSQGVSNLIVEVMKRSLYLAALLIGASIVALRGVENPELDDRPAPWILYGLLIGIGVFLIHNLIEFSLFEPGTSCLFGLLAGAVLGTRQITVARSRRRTPWAIAALVIVCAAWGAALLWIFVPVAGAETDARAGDEALAAGKYAQAAEDYASAWRAVPSNADYAYRAGRALHYQAQAIASHGKPQDIPAELRAKILSWYGVAADANQTFIPPHLARAALEMDGRDRAGVMADFGLVLELNPNDVSIRLDYAYDLEALGMRPEAREQLQKALWYNDQLDAAETKRLSPDRVKAIAAEIDSLGK